MLISAHCVKGLSSCLSISLIFDTGAMASHSGNMWERKAVCHRMARKQKRGRERVWNLNVHFKGKSWVIQPSSTLKVLPISHGHRLWNKPVIHEPIKTHPNYSCCMRIYKAYNMLYKLYFMLDALCLTYFLPHLFFTKTLIREWTTKRQNLEEVSPLPNSEAENISKWWETRFCCQRFLSCPVPTAV